MTVKDRATLTSDLSTAFPDNVSGLITPEDLRLQQTDIIDSYINFLSDQSIPDDIIFVETEGDFPTPVGGISTLEEKTYLISSAGDIDVSFRLKFANSRTVVTGLGRLFSAINFTNVSVSDANIINDPNISVTLTDAFVKSPNAPMFDCVGGANAIFTLGSCVLDDCTDLGQINGFVRTAINEGTLVGFNVSGGLDVLGNSSTVLIENIQSAANSVTPTFSMDDAGLTITNLSMSNITASLLTGSNQFAEIDPTKVVGGLVADSSFSVTDPLGSAINNTTTNFVVDRVGGIEETRKIGSVSLTTPVTVAIVTQSVPVEVGGTWAGASLSQFSLLNPGIQYDGLDFGDVFHITATINGTKPGGTGSNVYSGAIYINDVLVSDSLIEAEISDKGGSLTMTTFTALATNDHITLYVANEDNTNDLDAVSAKIEVNRVS